MTTKLDTSTSRQCGCDFEFKKVKGQGHGASKWLGVVALSVLVPLLVPTR